LSFATAFVWLCKSFNGHFSEIAFSIRKKEQIQWLVSVNCAVLLIRRFHKPL
jgi:hypothetical protein